MNYINRSQNEIDLSVSVGDSYYEGQLMHIFLDNFHQGGKYIAQISSHQEELRREEKLTNQNFLSITSIQTDYLNLSSSSCSGRNNERANLAQKNARFVEVLTILQRFCFKDKKVERKSLCRW